MQADLELSPIGNCQVSALLDREGAFVWGWKLSHSYDP